MILMFGWFTSCASFIASAAVLMMLHSCLRSGSMPIIKIVARRDVAQDVEEFLNLPPCRVAREAGGNISRLAAAPDYDSSPKLAAAVEVLFEVGLHVALLRTGILAHYLVLADEASKGTAAYGRRQDLPFSWKSGRRPSARSR